MPDPEVDPRFDPRFQRGFDDRRSSLSGSADVDRRSSPSRPAPEERPAPPDEPTRPVAPPAHSAGELELPSRNPYRLALLVVSIAAVVVSAGLYWTSVTTRFGPTSTVDATYYFLTSAASSLAPSFLAGGVIGIVLWIAVGAFLRHAEDAADLDG